MKASAFEDLSAVARSLLEAGADPDIVSANGNSALIVACLHGCRGTALLLAGASASLNQLNAGGETALDVCAGKEELAEVAAAIRAKGGSTAAELKAL